MGSFLLMSKRARNQSCAERRFAMPGWGMYFRSKFRWYYTFDVEFAPKCLQWDPDLKEEVDNMVIEAGLWRKHLALVDKDQLWELLLDLVAREVYDLEVRHVMVLFPNPDEYESYRKATTWMQ